MKIEEKFDKKLLVEGNDDQHVLWTICREFKIAKSFDIIDSEGVSTLISNITVRAKQRDVRTLGILVDADTDLNKRWAQIANELKGMNYSVPDAPNIFGTLIPSPALNRPQVGIWLMPNNQLPGMIEDFIRFLIPENEESLALAEETITTLEERNLQQYIPNHRAKALIHTWLAWQEDPGTPLGQAITKRYLTIDTTIATQLVQWLNSLFNP